MTQRRVRLHVTFVDGPEEVARAEAILDAGRRREVLSRLAQVLDCGPEPPRPATEVDIACRPDEGRQGEGRRTE